MLLEFQTFPLIWAVFLLVLAVAVIAARGSHPTTNDSSNGPRDKPKVVTLGLLQCVVNIYRFVSTPSVPPYERYARIGKDCGDVVTIRPPFRREAALYIAELSAAKPIMSSSAWENRLPKDHYFHDFLDGEPVGILFGNGGYWKQGRKLVLRLFQRFGFYREETIEKIAQFEAKELLEKEFLGKIRQHGGETAILAMHHIFQIYALNVVYRVLARRRFQREDPKFHIYVSLMNAFNENYSVGASLLDLFPWLRHLPFVRFNRHMAEFSLFSKEYFEKEFIEPRRKSGRYKTNPLDFVDYFLLEIDNRAEEDPCYVNDANFVACMRDLFYAAMDTTSSSLEHAILHVCLQDGIQKRVQEEIDQVIGGEREPCYEDRKRMPYTQAVLYEILRYSTPIAMVTRCPLRDEVIQGQHKIAKDSYCAINLFAIHRSTEVWSDPDEFRPERFLNEQNELTDLDKIIPFGYGKRACPGEFVAKISMFIFFVSLLQKFTFELSKAHGPPCMKNVVGLTHGPFPYYVKVSQRAVQNKENLRHCC